MKYLLSTVLMSLTAFPALACPGVDITDGWIREAPPGAKVMAGYVQLHNQTTKTHTITQIRSKNFGAIEIHQTVMEDGESRMLSLDTLAIPPKAQIRLAPGGIHLMLFRPRQTQPHVGDTVVLEFRCGKGKISKIPFQVNPAS